jgi:hypothetical protein
LTHPFRALRLQLAFLLVVCAWSALGAPDVRAASADDPSPEPARFLIEKITVEGPKAAAANIVRTESLLREGGSYSEEQLRQAIYRIHRLPFVLDASFSLRKGSRRGAFELVIAVEPARWFFLDQWTRGYRFGEPLHLETRGFTSEDRRYSVTAGGLAGARLFVGRSGVAFAALDSEEGFQAGFTQYDLFHHKGTIASFGFSTNVCCIAEPLPLGLDPRFANWSFSNSRRLSLNLTVPLGGPQSLQIALSDRAGGAGLRQEILSEPTVQESGGAAGSELSYRRAEVKWVYDTSDDPVVPSRGATLSAGLEAARFAGHGLLTFDLQRPQEGLLPAPSFSAEQVVAALSAVRYWPISTRQTISGTARVAVGRSQIRNLLDGESFLDTVDLKDFAAFARLQHSLTLLRSRGRDRVHDLRWETAAEMGYELTTPRIGTSPLYRFQLDTSLVYRDQWGRLRASLTYLSFGKVVP